MAEEGTELPIPLNKGEEDDVAIPIEPVVLEEVKVPRELNEDRYRLKAPTFSGEEAVEQFIQGFQDVMEVAQWPPRVALLELRMALTDKANVTQMTVASKVAQMTDMLAKLVSTLAPPNQVDTAREPSGPQAQSPGTGHPFWWECGRPGHFQKSCPELQPGLNYHGPQTLPPPVGRR